MNDSPDTLPAVEADYEARYMVVNCTNEVISGVVCIHSCAEAAWTNKVSAQVLGPAEATSVQTMRTRAWWADVWCVASTRQEILYVRGGLGADVPRQGAGGLCIVTIGNHAFTIIPPAMEFLSRFSVKPPFFVFNARELPGNAGKTVESANEAFKNTGETVEKDKHSVEGVDEEYTGSFTVINATNGPITDVRIMHECNGAPHTLREALMEKDTVSLSTRMTSASGHRDYWSVSFRINGNTKSRDGKQCNYVAEDSPQTCLIILYEDSFSLIIPVSDPCLINHY